MGAAERGTGITTTCLWMDIPALTLAGKTSVSRAGRSILCASGLAEPVTDTPGQFVEAATALARDADRFRDLRLTMRRHLVGSPLMDHVGFTCNLEAAYRRM